MSGHGDIPMTVKAMKGGAVDFLTKPFRDQEMLDAVTRAYPTLYNNGMRGAEKVAEFYTAGCPGLRLYRLSRSPLAEEEAHF